MNRLAVRRLAIGVLPVLSALAAFTSASAAGPTRPNEISNEIYVWQRVWTPSLDAAIKDITPSVSGFRVLVAEANSSGELVPVAVNWFALSQTRRNVIAVFRIDGTLSLAGRRKFIDQVSRIAKRWPPAAVRGLEIDYDCATSKLAAYEQFLRELRRAPGHPARLSVTALPAWLGSNDLEAILDTTDEVVLQVHAVREPRAGLFEPRIARTWINRLAAIDPKPFRVALPDYGARVTEGRSGRILVVESEAPRLVGGASAEELMAEPADVSALLGSLRASPPNKLSGMVWFRLPTGQDVRIWSLGTLQALMSGSNLDNRIEATTDQGVVEGMLDVALVNRGATDAPLPASLLLPPQCRVADGINGYGLAREGGRISLDRLQIGLLRAQHRMIVGWMRCSGGPSEIHVRL